VDGLGGTTREFIVTSVWISMLSQIPCGRDGVEGIWTATEMVGVAEELVCWQALVWVIETPGGQVRVVQENGREMFHERKRSGCGCG
jgi:hypothetical protein